MRATSAVGIVLALSLSGCLTSPAGSSRPSDRLDAVLAFSPPLRLTTQGEGFEPSIAASADGTLVATAAKTQRPNEGGRLASWLWYSKDGGATWSDLPLPTGPTTAYWGGEGDITVDAQGRIYFSDVYLADTALTRWSPGPVWDWTRDAMATTAPIDDRPWIEAHGDGVVYLVINTGPDFPTTGDLAEGRPTLSSKWLYRSVDAGLSWTLGQGLWGDFCMPAASPADDQTLLMVCQGGEGSSSRLEARWSTDRGRTLPMEFSPNFELGTSYLAPGAAIDAAGTGYAAWLDDLAVSVGFQETEWQGDQPGHVKVAARGADGTWTMHDVTPFPARLAEIHACAGKAGTLGLSFYATTDLVVTARSKWFAYAMVSHDADASEPAWKVTRLAEEPAGAGTEPPGDFFECVVAPDNRVHVIFQLNKPEDTVRDGPARGLSADVFVVRQVLGANLAT
jgi:hypothetical protein